MDMVPAAGKIESVYSEDLRLNESFVDLASRFASDEGTVILMSGGGLDSARYHILATRPWLFFRGRGRQMVVRVFDEEARFTKDPFETLKVLTERFKLESDMPQPVTAGLFGYLAYDLKDSIEDLPRTSVDDLGLPGICFYAPSIIVVHDLSDDSTSLHIPTFSGFSPAFTEAFDLKKSLGFFKTKVSGSMEEKCFGGGGNGFKSHFSQSEYVRAIERVKSYINAGHIYQVNMSQRFETDFEGDSFALFQALYRRNPAPFFSFVHAGNHQIVSTSPERFIKGGGGHVETRPIKGTRPRGLNRSEDEALKVELETSKKDDAELSMIVDLMRNDLGKVCRAGSVKVSRHKSVEAYTNVYHLVSMVEGELVEGADAVDILRATFPGGSITGCPKIRAMEIIDELEPVRRHIYTGSIGYVGFHDTMDFSIAIRTATILDGRLIFSVGGGIVYDSDPHDEYEETLHKGETLMRVFDKKNHPPVSENFGWQNGLLKPIGKINLNFTSAGVQYGFGFFETIRVDRGVPCALAAHMDRFDRAWRAFYRSDPPHITWQDVIGQVVGANNLSNTLAAVKILVSGGQCGIRSGTNDLIVTARPYTHRLEVLKTDGLDLLVYPHPRQTPLADHKTLNYLYYHLGGKWAMENGGHEALIMNPPGSVSETNTGNLMLVRNGNIILPKSPHMLSGIMAESVTLFFKERGYALLVKDVFPEDLFNAEHLIVTNSLMGAVPVKSVGGRAVNFSPFLADEINAAVL